MVDAAVFKVLDADNVRDPEVLVDVLGELLSHQRQLEMALGMVATLVLYQMHEIGPVGDEVVSGTIGLLKEFLGSVADNEQVARRADFLRDFLESKE